MLLSSFTGAVVGGGQVEESIDNTYGFVYAGKEAEKFDDVIGSADFISKNLVCDAEAAEVMDYVLDKDPETVSALQTCPTSFL